jgi:predicted nucleotidyltransferase
MIAFPQLSRLQLPPGRESAREDIALVLEALLQEFGASRIVAFGSCVSGKPQSDSDVDLLVVTDPTRPISKQPTFDANLVASRVSARVPLDILVRSPEEWAAAVRHPTGVIGEAVQHGITLYEG